MDLRRLITNTNVIISQHISQYATSPNATNSSFGVF